MARAKVAGDDQAAVELERMAAKFAAIAEYYHEQHENARTKRPGWPTQQQYDENQAFLSGLANAYERACSSLVLRASRLRNGTAGR